VSRFTKGEVDRLGERLRSSEVGSEDLKMLGEYRDEHLGALATVVTSLVDLRPQAALAARQKNGQTIIGKLREQMHMQLSNMQDIAGARLNVRGGRRLQDEVVAEVCRRFPNHKQVKDRREEPSNGYRAVHVVVGANSCWAEVQVRTQNQDRWAQTFERLGDQWGRQIRYGKEPDLPDTTSLVAGALVPRSEVVRYMRELSDMIDDVEVEELRVLEITGAFRRAEPGLTGSERQVRWDAVVSAQQELHKRQEDIDAMFMALAEAVPVGLAQAVEVEHIPAPALGSVQHFLVVYRRSSGFLEKVRSFSNEGLAQAVKLRSTLEEEHRTDPDLEVVLLASGSESDIRSTHARYFESVGELTKKKEGGEA